MARTVLIVDDHPFRAVARASLPLEGFAVLGEAADALSALVAVGRLRSNAGCRRPGPWVHPTGATYWRGGAPRWSAERCACSGGRRPAWRWRSRQSRSLTCPRIPD